MAKLRVTMDWDAVKSDAVEFARKLLKDPSGNPVEPTPAQIEILRGIRPWTVLNTGRQFGKTSALAMDGTWFGATHPNRTVMVGAPSLEQAKLIFNEIVGYFQHFPLSTLVASKPREYPFPELRLKNGTVYMARGTNSPQYIRGNRVHRFYGDEASFMKDSVITDVIEPMFNVTSKQEPDYALVLASTPFGRGVFYDYYQAGLVDNPTFKSFHYTAFDNPHANMERLYALRDRVGEDSLLWRTEYLALFDTDERAVIPWADIKYAYEEWPFGDDFPVKPENKHRYVQGVDLANMRDYFVATIVDETDPLTCYLARLDRHQKKGYPFYKGLVRNNYQAYNRPKTLVDSTSLGQSVAQDLADIGAEGYAMGTDAVKWEIVQELARMFSERRLLIPNRRDIIDELRFFEYEITPSKRIKAQASQGHDDIFMSLALCAHQCAVPNGRLGLMRPVYADRPTLGDARSLIPAAGRLPRPGEAGYEDPFAALFRDDDDTDA